jgi:two-component system LytT family response regulator
MPRWKLLIVDDEALARSNLQLALVEHPDWELSGLAASAAEARVAMVQRPADLVLLDIQMPRQNGLAYAGELAALAEPPLVIFVTAHDEHALAAFEVHALDYLLKPLDDARLAQALQRAAQLLERQQRGGYASSMQALLREQAAEARGEQTPSLAQIVVRSVGSLERVAISEIRWLASAGNYVELYLDGRSLLHRATLSALEQRLPAGEFLRVHRTALVRPAQIAALNVLGDGVYNAQLHDGSLVPVSERYVAAVRALFS